MFMSYLEHDFTTLINTGFVQLTNEADTIELVQRLRRNGEDMERVNLDLQKFTITLEL